MEHAARAEDGPVDPAEIEAQLLQHPRVKAAVVMEAEDGLRQKPVVAYVVPDIAALKATKRDRSSQAGAEIINRWNKLYELTYSRGPAVPSFVGWNSSYTRQPIPEEQMQEWLLTTLQRIRALKPRKVLEIGCGVGLLLQHLAPECETYVGTDLSASALRQLQGWIAGREDLKHVTLMHRLATELEDVESGAFDTIVINSVVQYFPDIDYLRAVLRETARLVRPGGNVFIGDVRHLGLLPMFHSAIQLNRAADSLGVGELRRRIARAVTQETELALDPAFFEAVVEPESGFDGADVRLRGGCAHNELTRYRYDVTLHVGKGRARQPHYPSLEWGSEVGSLAALEEALSQRRWPRVHVHSIPNERLASDRAAQRLIEGSDAQGIAGSLRAQWSRLDFDDVDPERIRERGDAHDYDVAVTWGPRGSPGCFEVRLQDRRCADRSALAISPSPDSHRAWSDYANCPLENRIAQQFLVELQDYLKARMPGRVLPSEWSVVSKLSP